MKSIWNLIRSPPSSDPSTKLQPAPLILFSSTFESYFSAPVKLFNHRLPISFYSQWSLRWWEDPWHRQRHRASDQGNENWVLTNDQMTNMAAHPASGQNQEKSIPWIKYYCETTEMWFPSFLLPLKMHEDHLHEKKNWPFLSTFFKVKCPACVGKVLPWSHSQSPSLASMHLAEQEKQASGHRAVASPTYQCPGCAKEKAFAVWKRPGLCCERKVRSIFSYPTTQTGGGLRRKRGKTL